MKRVALLLLLALPLGCASIDVCRVRTIDTLYFGTATPHGVVTEEQWRTFLSDVVTPRFPGGLTTWEANGQWRGADGKIVQEHSHVVQIVETHAGDTARILEIIASYKKSFEQEAVMKATTRSCVEFE